MLTMQEKSVISTDTTNHNDINNMQANILSSKRDMNIDMVAQMTKTLATMTTDATSSTTNTGNATKSREIQPNLEKIEQKSSPIMNNSSSTTITQQQQQQQQPPPPLTSHTPKSNVIATRPTKRTANDYRFGKTIGEGSFSTVYLAKDIYTNKEVAIKVCEKQLIIREKKERYIQREREVMHILSGTPGFVNLLCTFQDQKHLYFVMTLAKNGDLLPYIHKVGSFDFKCTQFYTAELIIALEQMHRKNIVHRDLKPENILLDENMHILIADFGSARILDEKNGEVDFESRKRANSFVGTAQYVSPEILRGEQLTKAADLWALGCIIYQMISGLPPFHAESEYLIFRKIVQRDLHFPDGFNKIAKDLVQRLIQIEPNKRLGAKDQHDLYESIRSHEFFNGIVWEKLRSQTPPPICPYLPGLDSEDELREDYRVPDHLEPGLGDKQMTRLLGLELGMSNPPRLQEEPREQTTVTVQKEDKDNNKWTRFAEGETILKQGFVMKRRGLFARKRMLLLATGPRLIYIDPVQMVKKGEIPMSRDLRCEAKNFKIFFVHTPNRTYYLEDPEGYALEWCQAIEDVRQKTYENQS